MLIISIIIPAYNSARFIENTLTMLISQDLNDCEIIVVNDGSTDTTQSICETFVSQYPEMKLINQSNQGVSAARNTGINAAQGKYIYFFDSDDTLTTDTLSYFKKVIKNNASIDIYTFGYEI
ncbi:hypothetical protein AGMMS50267_18360 [Spirochaetia bacterium]|nr:hypothetical protein AGMMS50267_18360 [Spirochaetia bacterium]